ncbi:GTP-binding protein (plasmid) [Thioclava litoralis]|uniref:GTP-binding protein n=1 Tax=Thioclava litoralis TaxID=3076557 RepID=A0ABZ1E7B4_9RHOB|nr:GTP-binding protein [Thioclava sp. FTW29]
MTQATENRCPVTVLTGFLGAGKTTLLNHLIRDPQAGRIAVVMNEFGDVGLDHDLIEEATEETVLLPSGCLCCTVLGDLAKTLQRLAQRKDAGEIAFDRVVIETSGVADPAPVIHTLATDHQIAQAYRLDGVVTVADAATGMAALDRQFEAVNQVAAADLVIVSKTDLVPPLQLARFEHRLGSINPHARQLHAQNGQVQQGVLFNLSAMRSTVEMAEVETWLGHPDPLAGLSGMAPKPAPFAPAPHSPHDHRISSASVTLKDPIPAETFDLWLDTLIALRGPDILRIKGILHVEDADYPFVFHGVQHIFEMPVPLKHWPSDDKTSRVVVIARDMTQADLDASLTMLRLLPAQETTQTAGIMVHSIDMPV